APAGGPVDVLEIQRPALRLLRKLPAFGEALDNSYRGHGRDNIIEELAKTASLTRELAAELRNISSFRLFTKNHLLFHQGALIDRLYLIRQGWLRRSVLPDGEDFLGHGSCFGLSGMLRDATWPYSVTVMGRTEVLEISVRRLRQNVPLREALARGLAPFAPPEFGSAVSTKAGVREM